MPNLDIEEIISQRDEKAICQLLDFECAVNFDYLESNWFTTTDNDFSAIIDCELWLIGRYDYPKFSIIKESACFDKYVFFVCWKTDNTDSTEKVIIPLEYANREVEELANEYMDFREKIYNELSLIEKLNVSLFQVTVTEMNEWEGEEFNYVLTVNPSQYKQLAFLCNDMDICNSLGIEISNYSQKEIKELNAKSSNSYMDFIGAYEFDMTFDEILKMEFYPFYKGTGLKKMTKFNRSGSFIFKKD